MLVEIKNWPGKKKNHSSLHGSTVTCLSMVIIIKNPESKRNYNFIGKWGDGEKANLPNLEFTR